MADFLASLKILRREVEDAYRNPREVWGLPSTFPSYNYLTGGYHPGQMVVLGAFSGHGKSSYINQEAFGIAARFLDESLETGKPPRKVVLISPEMTDVELQSRYLTHRTGIPERRIKQGFLDPDEKEAIDIELDLMERFAPLLHFDAGDTIHLNDILQNLHMLHATSPIGFAIVDYIQLVRAPGGTREGVTTIARELKILAKQLHIPLLVASQFRKAQSTFYRDQKVSEKDIAPDADMLKESADIEHSADVVALLYNKQDPDDPHNDTFPEVAIHKNRSGGVGKFYLIFHGDRYTFEDIGKVKGGG